MPDFRWWTRALTFINGGVFLYGLSMVVAPRTTVKIFSRLVYASSDHIDLAFGPDAVAYVQLTHAVMGSVMVGWSTALMFVLKSLFAQQHPLGWTLVATSLTAWFIPDTVYSLASGFWQNAVLNVAFGVSFAVPLVATRKYFVKAS
jgi:hypothetical protein